MGGIRVPLLLCAGRSPERGKHVENRLTHADFSNLFDVFVGNFFQGFALHSIWIGTARGVRADTLSKAY